MWLREVHKTFKEDALKEWARYSVGRKFLECEMHKNQVGRRGRRHQKHASETCRQKRKENTKDESAEEKAYV